MAQERTPRLFNDLYFPRLPTALTPNNATWTPFPRLPTELRLHVWQVCLRQHRMIGIDIHAPIDELGLPYPGRINPAKSWYYKKRNHRGKVVSGRTYLLSMPGVLGYDATALSPLLWVNAEARQTALSFYHIRLPFPTTAADKVLYLNADYDVVFLSVQGTPSTSRPDTLLADFLHDAAAFDLKDQGIAHLAIHDGAITDEYPLDTGVHLVPSELHWTAASSFTRALTHTLRTVLCVVSFTPGTRGRAEPTGPLGASGNFSQDLPLAPFHTPTAPIHSLAADPRVGVRFKMPLLSLATDPRAFWRSWESTEQAFGVTRAGGGGAKFYICPWTDWVDARRRLADPWPEERAGFGQMLGEYLWDEADEWRRRRVRHVGGGGLQGFQNMVPGPGEGNVVDAATFWRMQEVPSTTVGMWMLEPDAFDRCIDPSTGRYLFNVSGSRPGLLLFDVQRWL